MNNGRFQRHDGCGQPRATEDREDRLTVRSAVKKPDSSLLTIRRAIRTGVATRTVHRRLIERNQDNARPDTTCVVMNCLTACQTLPWPARSPDLSSVVHV
ncbi:hypothetical protein TNCV_981371 [Trichonephila clavipes]|uniref:Transposase Tc1-like domain-containing protein n=1 Tax=Trichonephila clavipes TaxID=2585209 RepID=A0A8X6S599_TRICX|nr:hypothetical protein TNCV_981371 [Trichonephila clavipes]